MRDYRTSTVARLLSATLILGSTTIASHLYADDSDVTTVYFTRHAEKLTVVDEVSPGIYQDNCNSDRSRCEEALNALGELRAQLLAEWFEEEDIAEDITHVISSDKQRTRQTVQPTSDHILTKYGTTVPDMDSMSDDGVWQVPFAGDKQNETKGNSGSVLPTVAAVTSLPLGSVAVAAGHSGTLYRIFGGEDTNGIDDNGEGAGLGIDTTQYSESFPKGDDGKVPNFGGVWEVEIRADGTARLKSYVNLQFEELDDDNDNDDDDDDDDDDD